MNTIGDRILAFRNEKGYKQKNLADLLGVKQTSISNWEGNFSLPERKYVQKMAELFNTSAKFIEYGEYIKEPHTNIHYIPYLTVKATASFIEKLNPENFTLEERFPVYFANNEHPKPNQIVIEIEGNSMEPTINDGSKVLVESIPLGDIVYINSGIYAVAFDSKFCVKRIKENELQTTGRLTLYSDNQNSGFISIKSTEIKAVWKAIRIVDQKL
jgi:phage repressor protein C with HTH and peptisase S24 domain